MPEIEPLSPERFGVRFTADAELRDLIDRARELARHRLPSGDLAALMKLALSAFVRSEEKRRFGVGSRARVKSDSARMTGTTPPGGVKGTENARATVSGGVEETENAGTTPPGGVKRARARLKVGVKREVFERDGGGCSFVSLDGRRCGARAWLEFDPVRPWARRGGDGSEHLRLLCGAHNRWYARQCFGALQVAARVAARSAVRSGARQVRVARCA